MTQNNIQIVDREGMGKEEIIYSHRFSRSEDKTRHETWKLLCRLFFQQFVKPSDTILDIGAGDGDFLKNIVAAKKIAVDINPNVKKLTEFGIDVFQIQATEMESKLGIPIDVIMMSNFLEHLPNKQLVIEILTESKKILKPGGKLMILQPNIRYTGAAYWDYIDHHIALTERSLCEALDIAGFVVEKVIPRFIPYSVKSKCGAIVGHMGLSFLIPLYLKLPVLWRFFGGQTFVLARA